VALQGIVGLRTSERLASGLRHVSNPCTPAVAGPQRAANERSVSPLAKRQHFAGRRHALRVTPEAMLRELEGLRALARSLMHGDADADDLLQTKTSISAAVVVILLLGAGGAVWLTRDRAASGPAAASSPPAADGDRVLELDGAPVAPLGVDGAIGKIRGVAGTTITVTLLRGGKPVLLIVERRKIQV
jgi:hypothetical protein